MAGDHVTTSLDPIKKNLLAWILVMLVISLLNTLAFWGFEQLLHKIQEKWVHWVKHGNECFHHHNSSSTHLNHHPGADYSCEEAFDAARMFKRLLGLILTVLTMILISHPYVCGEGVTGSGSNAGKAAMKKGTPVTLPSTIGRLLVSAVYLGLGMPFRRRSSCTTSNRRSCLYLVHLNRDVGAAAKHRFS